MGASGAFDIGFDMGFRILVPSVGDEKISMSLGARPMELGRMVAETLRRMGPAQVE